MKSLLPPFQSRLDSRFQLLRELEQTIQQFNSPMSSCLSQPYLKSLMQQCYLHLSQPSDCELESHYVLNEVLYRSSSKESTIQPEYKDIDSSQYDSIATYADSEQYSYIRLSCCTPDQ